MIPNVEPARHSFSACPCGHSEHVGRRDRDRLRRSITCEVCDTIEREEQVTIVIETEKRVKDEGLRPQTAVLCERQLHTIVSVRPIFRQIGAVPVQNTGYVRLKVVPSNKSCAVGAVSNQLTRAAG